MMKNSNTSSNNNNNQRPILMRLEKPNSVMILAVGGLMIGALLLSTFMLAVDSPFFCTFASTYKAMGHANNNNNNNNNKEKHKIQLETILHYATSRVVPQQSKAEIRLSLDVLQSISPCNFLVFGLGHDSQMWHSFNEASDEERSGTTLFLEEDHKWIQTVLKDAPFLYAKHVHYRTKLNEADNLLKSYRSEPDCVIRKDRPPFLQGNERCRLALNELPDEVYNKQWDVIMIDAPRGYFGEAPGRMAAIYSAAVMARNRRKGTGVTHVFLHDVDRTVEKAYAEEFLCRKYMARAEGRLWHFAIPSAEDANFTSTNSASPDFCY